MTVKTYNVIVKDFIEGDTPCTLSGTEVRYKGELVGHVVEIKDAQGCSVDVVIQLIEPLKNLQQGPFSMGTGAA
jgi:hypothetical protein